MLVIQKECILLKLLKINYNMKFIFYIVKECARVLLKKGHKEHSDLVRGLLFYFGYSGKKKSFLQVVCEVNRLFNYWNAFPDTYFRFMMFDKSYCDKDKIYSFVPQEAYNNMVRDKNLWYHILLDDKIIFHDLMKYYAVPVPNRYFIYRNGDFRNGSTILDEKQVEGIIKAFKTQRIYIKYFTGGAASGISVILRNEKDHLYRFDDGTVVTANSIVNRFKNMDIIFEEQIIQSHTLSKFNTDTVNTIRVMTFNGNIISAAVRFGGKGSFVDNTAKGGVAVSLDIDTGYLGEYGMREYDENKYYEHPDSKLEFKNTFVPEWNEVKELVLRTCKYLPYYKSVGFDIATTDNGPIIIEINNGSGIYLSQMGKEYGLSKFFTNKKNK